MKIAQTVLSICETTSDAELMKKFKERHPYASGQKVHSGPFDHDKAKEVAKKLRAEGKHGTIWHIGGPKSGKKSLYVVMI